MFKVHWDLCRYCNKCNFLGNSVTFSSLGQFTSRIDDWKYKTKGYEMPKVSYPSLNRKSLKTKYNSCLSQRQSPSELKGENPKLIKIKYNDPHTWHTILKNVLKVSGPFKITRTIQNPWSISLPCREISSNSSQMTLGRPTMNKFNIKLQ